MSDCACGHLERWHRHDRFAGRYCLLCAKCSREQYDHKQAIGHRFTTCNCMGESA